MQKATVERRLKALESMQVDRLGKTIVVFHDLDGTVHHNEDTYPDLAAAQVANPGFDLWVVVECQDMSAQT